MQNIIKHNAETFSEMLISLVLKSLDLANRLKQRPESEKIGPSKSTCFSSIPNRICSKPRWVWGTWCLMVSPFTMTDSHARIAQVSTLAVREIDSPLCNVSANQYIGLCRCESQSKLDACWMPAGCLLDTWMQLRIRKNQATKSTKIRVPMRAIYCWRAIC